MGFSVPGQNTQNTAPRSAPVATSRAGNYATTMTRQQDAALAPAMPSEPVKYEADGRRSSFRRSLSNPIWSAATPIKSTIRKL